MFCERCGTESSVDAIFCRNCGVKLPRDERAASDFSNEVQSATQERPQRIFQEGTEPRSADTLSEYRGSDSSRDDGLHPWRRFFARTLDLMLLGVPIAGTVFFFVGFLFPELAPALAPLLANWVLAGVVVYLLWLPIEAFLLSAFATTPAKWIFGIRVLEWEGGKLPYLRSLSRAVLVCIQGDALGVPLLAAITRFFAYRRLYRTGTTLWDETARSYATHRKWTILRGAICGLAFLLALTIFSLASASGSN